MGGHLNVQLPRADTIYLANLPQGTAPGTDKIVESTGQGQRLDLLTAQINPASEIVEAGEGSSFPLLNNPSRRLGTDTGDIGKPQPHGEAGIAPMVTVITIGIKGSDLGFVVVAEAALHPRFQAFTAVLFVARIQ